MLNISNYNIQREVEKYKLGVFGVLKRGRVRTIPLAITLSIVALVIIVLFLPWTQNIDAKGYVTTRLPEQRPQSIHTVLSGRIERWYVREGDFVSKGDTIMYITEVKSEYFDSSLVDRTVEQIKAKEQSVESYQQKVVALRAQYKALLKAMDVKREQTVNKINQTKRSIHIDSMDLKVYSQKLEIAKNQFERTRELHAQGLKSLTELQEKELKYQEAQGMFANQQNKLLNQSAQYDYMVNELAGIEQEYNDKLSKSLSEQQSALSAEMEASVEVSKMRSMLANYSSRQGLYYITAPQSGYITRTVSRGLGEVIKEGDEIAIIVPEVFDLAVEIFIPPQDLPLIKRGDPVRLRFDGWPAVVFSGWPAASTGVFDGRVDAIERYIGANGMYRLLVSPDANSRPWPAELSNGTGVYAFVLLKDVPVWFEIWRVMNGFPADYYSQSDQTKENPKKK